MSVINDEKANDQSFHQIRDDVNDAYLSSESSEVDYSDDEFNEDRNNNKATADKETSLDVKSLTNDTEQGLDRKTQVTSNACEDNESAVVDDVQNFNSSAV